MKLLEVGTEVVSSSVIDIALHCFHESINQCNICEDTFQSYCFLLIRIRKISRTLSKHEIHMLGLCFLYSAHPIHGLCGCSLTFQLISSSRSDAAKMKMPLHDTVVECPTTCLTHALLIISDYKY